MVETKKPSRAPKAKKPEATEDVVGQESATPDPQTPPEKPNDSADSTEPKDGPEPEKPDNQMVMVRNLRRLDYVQPSTQVRIHGYSKTLLLDDVWLQMQCEAKLLEKV